MKRIDEEVRQLEAEIADDEDRIAALRIKALRERNETLDYFQGLSDGDRTELYHTDPEAYMAAMQAIQRRNERRLLNKNRPGGTM